MALGAVTNTKVRSVNTQPRMAADILILGCAQGSWPRAPRLRSSPSFNAAPHDVPPSASTNVMNHPSDHDRDTKNGKYASFTQDLG